MNYPVLTPSPERWCFFCECGKQLCTTKDAEMPIHCMWCERLYRLEWPEETKAVPA
jgi:hypothetical protein